MTLGEFLRDLFEGKRTRVAAPYDLGEIEISEAREFLANFESLYRLNIPGEPPRLDLEAALWAAVHYYKACQYAVFREHGPDFAFTPAERAIAALESPDSHYSVDLVFRFLPDLMAFCRSATEDPLHQELLKWARQWPLSAVGIIEAHEVDIAPLLGSASLMQVYADRAIESGDVRALQSARGAQAIEESLGLYQELAPELMRQLALNAIPSDDEQAGSGE